jgi:hypothetical protein
VIVLTPQSDPDGLFDGRIRAIRAMEKKWLGRRKGRLGEKARTDAAVRLSGMHQKRMTQVDGSRASRSQRLAPGRGFLKTVGGELLQR